MKRTDSIEMLYVNPYDVLGSSAQEATEPYNSHQDDTIATLENSSDVLNGGTKYLDKDTLPMEEFSDLSAFLPMTSTTKSLSDSVDELNTPVIDKEAFNFTSSISDHSYGNVQQHINIKEEAILNDCVYGNNNNMFNTTNNNDYLNDISVKIENHLNSAIICADQADSTTSMSFNNHINNIATRIESSVLDEHLLYNNSHKNSVLSMKAANDEYSNVTSPVDGSTVSTTKSIYLEKNPQILKLNVHSKSQDFGFDINTPDIIESVVSLENENPIDYLINFNFNREDYAVINDDIISTLLEGDTLKQVEINVKKEEPKVETKRTTRKRKTTDDDDEDYVPPKRFMPSSHEKKLLDLLEEEEEEEKKEPKRGRRPVRTVSESSDQSKDSDVSKYRELRDKNNEASKRSRLKRKVKEYRMEKEADELNDKNVKLKARVAELERMVSSFRNNLFKTLIKK